MVGLEIQKRLLDFKNPKSIFVLAYLECVVGSFTSVRQISGLASKLPDKEPATEPIGGREPLFGAAFTVPHFDAFTPLDQNSALNKRSSK